MKSHIDVDLILGKTHLSLAPIDPSINKIRGGAKNGMKILGEFLGFLKIFSFKIYADFSMPE